MEGKAISLTIGTAGHVDHGKTTLVRRLTGTDTDRLEEEHRRGISIVPGYAELELPGGHRASLVDVPGHERFVKNMVAGSTGVDAFLLVVAADDGVMPQTREHLDVLRVLGVECGVVALSKIDAVDAETAELAELDVDELLESVGLEAPVVRVSGVTGEGEEDLLAALSKLAGDVESGQDLWRGGGMARLPVDRAFVLKGIGLVVTGTLWSGEIRVGGTLYTASGLRPRVRGIQNHGHPAEVARPGARTALDLAGVESAEIEAGDVLLSRPVRPTRALDSRVRLLESAAPLRHGSRLRLHHGASSTNARVRLPGGERMEPGNSASARLVLQEEIVALPGDRFVLRSLSPQVTVGGGTVLDPAPIGRSPDPTWLAALESGDAARVLPLALSRAPREGMTAEELSLIAPLSELEVEQAAGKMHSVTRLGGIYALAEEIEAARKRLLSALQARAEGHPESPELSVADARTAAGLAPRLTNALLEDLEGSAVKVDDTGISIPTADDVPEELEKEAACLLDELCQAGVEPPAAGMTPAARLLVRRGEAVRVGDGMLAAKEVEEQVLEQILDVCQGEGEITLADLRDRLGTSRKYAQAWLEHADTAGVTRRIGDARVLTRRHR